VRWFSASTLISVSLCLLFGGCGTTTGTVRLYVVRVIRVPGAGSVLADGAGYPLYIYENDQQGPSKCTLACAAEWPPLVLPPGVRHPVAGSGVDAALLGTARRVNHSLQVTYNRWPLYTYRDDAPAQPTGQGAAMGAWYLISPNGTVDHQPVTSPGG